jgi:hypothetical protein
MLFIYLGVYYQSSRIFFFFCYMAFKGVYILIEDLLTVWQTEGKLRCALLENTYISSKEGNYSKTIGPENVRCILYST